MADWKNYWPRSMWEDIEEKCIGGRMVQTFSDLPESFYHALAQTVRRRPEGLAIVDNWERRCTYRELLARVDGFAAYLVKRQQIQKGEQIGLLFYNCLEFCVAFLALCKLGAVTVPLPGKFKAPEVVSLARKANITAVICDEDFAEWFLPLTKAGLRIISAVCGIEGYGFAGLELCGGETIAPQGNLEDVAMIMFTSGTTSQSKGVLLKNYNLMHAVAAYQRVLGITQDDRSIIAAPIYHITGMVALLGLFIYAGGALWIHNKVEGERLLRCAVENHVTFMHASPAIFLLLLEQREKFPAVPSLRGLACGSSNMPAESIRKLKEWLPNADFHTVYGLTETSSPGTIFPGGAADSLYLGSSGLPIPGVELEILGENGEVLLPDTVGEILVRGTVVLEAYYQQQCTSITPDGWLHTGDLGYLNTAGYLYVVDRIKDMINRGGEKICSFDVENELYCLPGVAEAAVVGIAHPTLGEVPAAVIRAGAQAELSVEAIRAALIPHLARYKIPERILFVEAVPRTPNGKTDKQAIRALFEKENERRLSK